MANTLLLKRQSTASAAPTTGQLALGELAVNSRDGTLFLKRNNGTTDQIVKVWTDQQLINNSQLTNDSNFITSTNIKTINGVSVVGTGNINTVAASAYEKRIFSTPTVGQTVFPISGGYPANKIEFFRNGIKLVAGLDYDASSGTQITIFGISTSSDDVFEAYWFDSVTSQSQVQVRDGGQDSGAIMDSFPGELWYMSAGNSLKLPSNPVVGNFVKIHKSHGFSMTVLRNSQNIMGLAEDMTINVYTSVQIEFVYVNQTYGWAIN